MNLTIYKNIEENIKKLDSIMKWNDKVNSMKEIKATIIMEQEQLNNIINSININEIEPEIETKKKKKNKDIDTLLQLFNESETIENKIKYYNYICNNISNIEKELFRE
jgi:hypothetical protein